MTTATAEATVKDDTAIANEGTPETSAAPKASAKKSVKKAPAKKPEPKEDGILTLAQATTRALKDNTSVDIGRIFVMPIGNITRYDNPRHEPENLYEQGYTLIGDPKVEEATETDYVSLVHLALSENLEHVRQYVDLIEQYEGPVMRLLNPQGKVVHVGSEVECKAKLKTQADKSGWKIDDHLSAPQSIIELAEDIFLYSQLDPIEVRQPGNKTNVIDGGRRIAAVLYLHAKSRVLRADKAEAELFGEGTPKEYPALIQATELKASGDDFLLACQINLSRKMFTPLQEGRVYHEMLEKINPTTGKKYTMKEAAAGLGVEYGTYRNREALWRDPEYDEEGTRTKGLSEPERRKVALGEMTVTAASRKALGERHYSETGAPAHNRNRGLPLSEMQKLFDETPDKNEARRQAIAECMGLKLKEAIAESDKRIEDQDRKSAVEHEKNKNKSKKNKAAAA
jgi:hypothetical protein